MLNGGVKYLLFNASFRITFWLRVGNFLKERNNFIFRLMYAIVFLIYKHQQWLTGIQIPIGTNVGKGLVFGHFSCIIVNGGAKIGENCTIYQGVTIGGMRGQGSPVIGNNVVIFAGAKIIGKVRVGDYAVIGVNAVVTKDVPDNAVVAGVPAKVLSYKGKETGGLYF